MLSFVPFEIDALTLSVIWECIKPFLPVIVLWAFVYAWLVVTTPGVGLPSREDARRDLEAFIATRVHRPLSRLAPTAINAGRAGRAVTDTPTRVKPSFAQFRQHRIGIVD
jgi:hypothetical protein